MNEQITGNLDVSQGAEGDDSFEEERELPERILVVPGFSAEELEACGAFLEELRLRRPNSIIDLLINSAHSSGLSGQRDVDNFLESPFKPRGVQWSLRARFGQYISGLGYDYAYVLDESFFSAMSPFLAGIPKRIGLRGQMRFGLLNDIRLVSKRRVPYLSQRYIHLLD